MKHAILGAGAIGGLIGTALAWIGEDVTIILRPESLAGYPKTLTLERPQGPISAPAKATAALTEPVDVLWIATKAYQLQAALESVHSSPRCVVPLLNGIDHVGVLRERFGRDRVVPAVIAIETEKIAPGKFKIFAPVVHLNLSASGEPLLGEAVRRTGDLGFVCQFVQNEQTLLWGKLCFLAPTALVTSASGTDKAGILASAEWMQKLTSAIAEACAVAKASGAEVDPARPRALFDGMAPSARSSMAKDLAAGHQIELDPIAGPIVRGGDRYGIDVSTTVGLVAAIRTKIARNRSEASSRP
jgi:2-dehydropantoate 2-reductase